MVQVDPEVQADAQALADPEVALAAQVVVPASVDRALALVALAPEPPVCFLQVRSKPRLAVRRAVPHLAVEAETSVTRRAKKAR